MRIDQVQETQGLYGPFTLTERVVQKVWLRQDFEASGLMTDSGKSLCIVDAGRWNLQEGPDFKEARLVIDGIECVGDVEVHFNVGDWHSHQHELDANFDRVVLHVVLYPERRHPNPVKTSRGTEPEVVYLLPVLNRDLESYVMDDALLELEQQDELEWVAQFIERPLEARLLIIKERARARWEQKMVYARKRLTESGWEAACHGYMLEVLGYARNRAPMLRLADAYPLGAFKGDSAGVAASAETLFAAEQPHWKLAGLRPANHPRRRLEQYIEIVRQQPNWPKKLAEVLQGLKPLVGVESSSKFRRAVGLPHLRKVIAGEVFSSCLGERRLNTFMCDSALPLATAAGILEGACYWEHWAPGDMPDALSRFLKHAQITDSQHPQSNGLNQGALALFFSRGA